MHTARPVKKSRNSVYVAPHLMVELRSAGFIEVCADGAGSALEELEVFFRSEFGAERLDGHEDYCDRYYRTGEGVFKEAGSKGQNNLGLLTTRVCDEIVKIPGWSLVTLNGGNYGEGGTHREQQLVFRWDSHPLREAPHLLVELRDAGFIEVCGQDVGGIYTKFAEWAGARWGCERAGDDKRFYDAKFKWKPASADMMVSTGQVIGFFHQLGWQMQVCSQGTVKVKGCEDSREQQIILRPGASGVNYLEPHLLIELYMGEGDDELHRDEAKTQLLSNQHVRMCPIGDCHAAVHAFHQFITDYMGGAPGDGRYNCDVFLGRGETDNNFSAGAVEKKKGSEIIRPPLRKYLMDGDFFIGTAIGSTMTKMALRFAAQVNDVTKQNRFSAECMLVISSILHLGASGLPEKAITRDDADRH